MFQEIEPHVLNNEHKNRKPEKNDYAIIYKDNKVLIYNEDEQRIFPTIGDIMQSHTVNPDGFVYLFDLDDRGFFLSKDSFAETGDLKYQDARIFREKKPSWLSFGGATAAHLAGWYDKNRFCGKCSHPMVPKETERALYCPNCGLTDYPKINPVIIVGIIDNDRLLLTKYAHAEYKKHSLVAGFTEIGETLEDTVKREVMEEVGLKVKNIRYYKSQPWAFSESLLVGFFADVDGNTDPEIDTEELSEADWFTREEIPADDSTFSLTWNMIERFRQGNV